MSAGGGRGGGFNVGDLQASVGLDMGDFDKGIDKVGSRFRSAKSDIEGDPIEPKVDESKSASGWEGLKTMALDKAIEIGAKAGEFLMEQFTASLERSHDRAKLAAQFGLTPDQAKEMGKQAGELYAQGYGESTKQVTESLGSTLQMGGLGDLTKEQFQSLTKQAMSLAEVMGSDVNEVTRAASTLMRNGLAKNAQEAFDIIAAGQQNGANSAGDMLDTINEYSVKFAQLGVTGPQMMNMLVTGMKNGARDTDFVADAFKELQIRMMDGSETSRKALGDIGVDSDALRRNLLAGGETAKLAFNDVITKLGGVKDGVKQNEAGLALFGTKWEDVGGKAIIATGQANEGLANVEGSAKRVDTTLSNSSKSWTDTFSRELMKPVSDWMDTTFTEENVKPWTDSFKNGLATIPDMLDPIVGLVQTIGDDAGGVLDTLENWVQIGWDVIQNGVHGFADALTWVKDHVLDPIWGTFQDFVRGVVNFYNTSLPSIAKSAAGLPDQLPMPFDTGGVVPGAVGSPQLVMAHAGEMILPTHRMGLGAALQQVAGGSTTNIRNSFPTHSYSPYEMAQKVERVQARQLTGRRR